MVGLASNLLGLGKASVVGEEALAKFLDRDDVVMLQCMAGEGGTVLFSNNIGTPGSKQDRQINLVKRKRLLADFLLSLAPATPSRPPLLPYLSASI